MAVLDALHSLLALMGATVVPGVEQAMLIQGAVPAVALFAWLIPPIIPAHAAPASADGNASPPPQPAKPPPSVLQRFMHAVNHNSPQQLIRHLLCSPRTYQIVGAALIAFAVSATVLEPEADENEPPVLLLRLLLGGSIAREGASSSSSHDPAACHSTTRAQPQLLPFINADVWRAAGARVGAHTKYGYPSAPYRREVPLPSLLYSPP